jgi:DNA mismatch endonuclease Vsr
MSRIRSSGTKPELQLQAILKDFGIAAESQVRVSGVNVDVVIGRILVFVDSPFWHLRDMAILERLTPNWREKLLRNRARDRMQTRHLRKQGFTVVRFWADELDSTVVSRRVRSAMARQARRVAF